MSNGTVIQTDYKYGFSKPENYVFKSRRGLDKSVVEQISSMKNEPEWMREYRLRALEIFFGKKMPTWGADLSTINFDDIFYYIKPTNKQMTSWKDLPKEIRDTYDAIGIPEAEKKFLGGVTAQYESESVYHSFQKQWEDKGVIFTDMDTGLKKYPDIVKSYFGRSIPPADNKFAALNSAVWSGGSMIYVPKGVSVDIPLQAYFRINAANMGQFERTLIIVDEGAYVHYVEGCLPAGEQVSLGDKWVNIESVKPSDLVVTEKGEFGKVKAVMTRNYRGKLVKITPLSPYNSFRLTTEHPVLCVKRQDVLTKRKPRNGWLLETNSDKLRAAKPQYIPAGELSVGDFIVFPKIKPSGKSNLTTSQLKLLGWYLAEGYTYIHKKLKMPIVTFSLASYELERLDEVENLIREVTGKNVYRIVDKNKRGTALVVYSKELRELCLKHCAKGAKTKLLSEEIMSLKWEQVKLLVDSYFEGDGSVYSKGRLMIRAATVSEQLARQIQELLARGGYYASIQVRKGGKDKILGREITRSDQYILYYAPTKRWSEVRATESYFLVPIKKIELLNYDGPVFNLDVESPNSYLVRGFAVHNCTAPVYSTDSLHAAVVEIFVKKGARCRYTTIQNWSSNVYNLVTKRTFVEEDGTMEWVDGNIGSKITMKYPSCYLVGRGARGEVLSLAIAGKGQHQDAGGKLMFLAPDTSGEIISKSVSHSGGRTSYRGLVKVIKNAERVKCNVRCDALILDEKSRSDTYPTMQVAEDNVRIGHEASVSRIDAEQLFYLMSRGLTEIEATSLIVNGFIEPIVKELPLEYAVELNRLIQLNMEGSVG